MLKCVNMNKNMKPICITSTADLIRHIARCQHMIDLCEDCISQFSGVTPDSFVFSFSIRGKEIVKFDISENESEFTMSFFISWLQYYRRTLTALEKML